MPEFRVECEGEAREVYDVTADSEEQARALVNAGDAGKPIASEINGIDIVSVELLED